MPYVSIRGVGLYYQEHGSRDDPTLLIAHGLMGSIAMTPRFGPGVERFAERGLHVFAYDARGHGRSGYTTKRAHYHWDALAEDMRALIHTLGLERASVYGGSMGAGTALMLALAHPETVEKLVLISPPPFGARLRFAARQFGALSIAFQLFGTGATARIVTALPQSRRLPEAEREGLRSFLAAQRRASIVPAIRGLLLDRPQMPAERFGEIAHPTLILTHPDDPIHPLASGELLHERLRHAKLAVAPSQTYWSESPDALTHVVSAFVKGESIARGLPPNRAHEHAIG